MISLVRIAGRKNSLQNFLTSSCLVLVSLLSINALAEKPEEINSVDEAERWQKISQDGMPVHHKMGPWACVLDKKTGLLWEVKSWQEQRQYYKATYSWFAKPQIVNGKTVEDFPVMGKQNSGSCHVGRNIYPCDTSNLIEHVRQTNLCGVAKWRIPTLQELSSLLYEKAHPGQAKVNKYLFPRTARTPYWTSEIIQHKNYAGSNDNNNNSPDQSSSQFDINADGAGEEFRVLTLNFYNGEVQALPSDLVATLRLVATTE
ncbi:DUF1566 domain-containing protein [Teredinibacter sp. KSP-S5-2]|uniref:Lcl domain-containing protein n=1 Tax=Teredinibacter sp. KSP-S5-2 TaxID=3034506 RepID=UPI0029352F57|nr:DUF1566 domain-containing protein [Teredinibacter sp. KSP-S5-2]WNO10012.1 DUF1566 domain-containing protein [Teredinibacter sp. KSP-S5-2]